VFLVHRLSTADIGKRNAIGAYIDDLSNLWGMGLVVDECPAVNSESFALPSVGQISLQEIGY